MNITRPTVSPAPCIAALIMVFSLLSSTPLRADGSRVYTSVAHGYSLRLPNAYACVQGRYDAQDYVSMDLLQRELAYPELREADTSFVKADREDSYRLNDAANAVAVRGPYNTYAVVFAAQSSYPSIEEVQRRLLEQVRQEALATGGNANDLLQTSMSEYTLSGLPALSLTLRRPVPNPASNRTDTLFTEIMTAQSGAHVYGIIMRGPEWMGRDAKTTMRQVFLSILYGMTVTIPPTDFATRTIEGTRIRCSLPTAWTKVFAKRVPFPVPVADFTPSTASRSRAEDSVRQEASVLVVQTPTFQCEFFVTALPALDSAAWAHTCTRIFDRARPASAQDPLDTRPAALTHLDAYEHSYSVFRRSDNVRTTWIACRLDSQLLLVRIVAWQRELTATVPVMDIISRCSIAP